MTVATDNKTPATPAFTVDAALVDSVLVGDPVLGAGVAPLLMVWFWTEKPARLHTWTKPEQNNIKSACAMNGGREEKYEPSISLCKAS